jgi:hypothetical protein
MKFPKRHGPFFKSPEAIRKNYCTKRWKEIDKKELPNTILLRKRERESERARDELARYLLPAGRELPSFSSFFSAILSCQFIDLDPSSSSKTRTSHM